MLPDVFMISLVYQGFLSSLSYLSSYSHLQNRVKKGNNLNACFLYYEIFVLVLAFYKEQKIVGVCMFYLQAFNENGKEVFSEDVQVHE